MLLPAILHNTQSPHQPLLLLLDTPAFSGVGVLAGLLRAAVDDGSHVILITTLHPPSSLLPPSPLIQTLDLSSFPSYPSPPSLSDITQWLISALVTAPRGTQVFIEGLDVLCEDLGGWGVGRGLVRVVLEKLAALKAPSRLTLLLPSSSPLLQHLTTPATSATLTQVNLHPPGLISHLAETYLLLPPPSSISQSSSPSTPSASETKFLTLLRSASLRRTACTLAYSGEGVEVGGGEDGEAVVEVLVRKAVGGAGKGMGRSLEGLRWGAGDLKALGWEEVGGLGGLGRRIVVGAEGREEGEASHSVEGQSKQDVKENKDNEAQPPAQQHPEQLHLPFNLTLTARQEASRASVPIPYAHEGDEPRKSQGGARILFEPEKEDDFDDDDPDEDLDF